MRPSRISEDVIGNVLFIEAEIDIEAVQQETDTFDGELAEVRGKMATLTEEAAA